MLLLPSACPGAAAGWPHPCHAQVEGKAEQAMRCYKRALALDPSVATAGSEPRPSWLSSLLAAVPEAGGGAKPARLRGEDSAAAGGGRGPPTPVRG